MGDAGSRDHHEGGRGARGEAHHRAGMKPWTSTVQEARTCCGRIDRPGGWNSVSIDQQLEVTRRAPRFVAWLPTTRRLQADAAVIVRADLRPGIAAPMEPDRRRLVRRGVRTAVTQHRRHRSCNGDAGQHHRGERRSRRGGHHRHFESCRAQVLEAFERGGTPAPSGTTRPSSTACNSPCFTPPSSTLTGERRGSPPCR